ncbi:MAG: site-specific integrase [Acidobacteria bacterium]|nr:site-specific integrase [Acidobacteriota bacterium]
MRYRFSLDVEAGEHVASKTEAETLATSIRDQINAGTFVRAADRRRAALVPSTPGAVTVRAFADTYLDRVSKVRERNARWTNDQHMFARICAVRLPDGSALGDKALGAVTEDDLEAVLVWLRRQGRAVSTRNQYVHLLKASMRWAVKKGYLARQPIAEDSTIIKRGKIAQRNRRLAPDVYDDEGRLRRPSEERRLLAAAGPRLQSLILAALETCCRRGELLSLQWRDVSLERSTLTIRAEHAKDREARVLPISARLAAVLKMARTDPAGKEYTPDAYVFGELGRQVATSKRAWETCVLKAHGHTPAWRGTALAPGSRAALQAIDLHFHDLRHEGGSRLLEAGWPLHHVQEMLGHASIEQTSTYLNVRAGGLLDSMRKLDAARIRGNLVANAAPIAAAATEQTVGAHDGEVTVN